jgi:2,3-bisphosphoglycerate-dependent phosphoglycerate mutase
MRYLLENLTEDAILAIDRQGDVANCAVTEYRLESSLGPHNGLVLERYNFTAPLQEAGAPVTSEPDLNVAAR